MIRVGELWDSFCSTANAVTAITIGTVNKRSDRVVRRKLGYTDDLPEHEGKLNPEKVNKQAKKLVATLEGGWQSSPTRHLRITPVSGKQREIDCPSLSDHLIHWMLILAIKRVLMRGMYEHSYGSIPGRGIDGARRTIERWVQHDPKLKYFVKLDIHKFYASVDHAHLKDSFRRVVKDKRILGVIDSVIDIIPSGLPIGAYTSQWFANFYLQPLDHHITQNLFKERRGVRKNYVSHYLRYMDDMLLIRTSKRDLEKAVRDTIRYCRDTLSLEIKPCWEISTLAELSPVPDSPNEMKAKPGTAPIDIVGYRFYRDHTEVRGSIFLHSSRIAAKISKTLSKRGFIYLHDAQALVSLCGWFSHADSEYYLANYINNRVNINLLKEVISYADKHGIVGDAARVFCGQRGRDSACHVLYGRSGGSTRRIDHMGSQCVDIGFPLE